MRVGRFFSLFKRFGLKTFFSDLVISLLTIFLGVFAVSFASQPSYRDLYAAFAQEYGDKYAIIDPLALIKVESLTFPGQTDSYFYDQGVEKDLEELGIEYQVFYRYSSERPLFDGVYGFYAIPGSISKMLPNHLAHGNEYSDEGPEVQFALPLDQTNKRRIGDDISFAINTGESSYASISATICASIGQHSFWRGDSYIAAYFKDGAFATFDKTLRENGAYLFGDMHINSQGQDYKVQKTPRVRMYYLANLTPEQKSAFLERKEHKDATLISAFGESSIPCSFDTYSDIYACIAPESSGGFNNVAHYPYFAVTAFVSVFIILIAQAWLGMDKSRLDSAVCIIVGATRKEILSAHFAKKILDTGFMFVFGYFVLYFLDYHAKSLYWPNEFYANTNLYWLYCLICGAFAFVSLGFKYLELRRLDFAVAIRGDE